MRRDLPPLRTMGEEPGEYVAFLEELQHAANLLVSGGIAQERMALAIIDSLAERLLYRHAQRCFSAGEATVGILTDPVPGRPPGEDPRRLPEAGPARRDRRGVLRLDRPPAQ
jgi:hypothetical protein